MFDAFMFSQLNVHNMGIYVAEQKKMLVYLWSEYEAKRGSSEMASVFWEFVQRIPEGIRELVHWSDNCTSQNKHWNYFFEMCYLVLLGKLDRIELRFLKKGTTSMKYEVYAAKVN
jgi:hypothetical protein